MERGLKDMCVYFSSPLLSFTFVGMAGRTQEKRELTTRRSCQPRGVIWSLLVVMVELSRVRMYVHMYVHLTPHLL